MKQMFNNLSLHRRKINARVIFTNQYFTYSEDGN